MPHLVINSSALSNISKQYCQNVLAKIHNFSAFIQSFSEILKCANTLSYKDTKFFKHCLYATMLYSRIPVTFIVQWDRPRC